MSNIITKREKFDEDIMKPLLIDPRYNRKDLNRLSTYNNIAYQEARRCWVTVFSI